jgi:hypothetical protein
MNISRDNILYEFKDEHALREFFRGFMTSDYGECKSHFYPGEIFCYRIACHAPEMIEHMPDIVKKRVGNTYSRHLDQCNTCATLFLIAEQSDVLQFHGNGKVH